MHRHSNIQHLRDTFGAHMRPDNCNALSSTANTEYLPTGLTSNFVPSVTWIITRLVAEVRVLRSDPLPQVVEIRYHRKDFPRNLRQAPALGVVPSAVFEPIVQN